ncbi:MAG: DNA polymerase III subunit alpha [Actinobacteria bacterium]|nr:DNA polymerase III subunit alpha [Actinomycetota bacterium]
MPGNSFVHLHVHTEYSMLDGAARLKELFAESGRLGMPAIAMTDHGNVYGAYDFYRQATSSGIKPIIGIEAYVAPQSRFHKAPVLWGEPGQRSDDVSAGGSYTHLTMLAVDATGLRNLFRLASRASLEGFYRKWPRMDRDLLAEHATGIIATTACPSGEVQTRLRLGQYQEALSAAADYRDIFGAGNYYLELMDHGIDIERRVRDDLLRIGRELGLPIVVTNDSHYVSSADAKAHDALLCVQTGKTLNEPGRFRLDGDGYYLKSAAEMRASWDGQIPGACDTTLLIAERVGDYGEVFAHHDRMPRFPVPAGETQETWLRREVAAGMTDRYPAGIDEERRSRVEYELDVIVQMGFPAYFLVVADLVRWAKENGVRVGPGRGSATGCLVAYALGIIELDPLEHRLLFERFLNPDRISMPDIDLDFDERRRGDMIRYVTERWGEDKVAQIVTYGKIKAKQALKDASRVLGYPYALGDRITKAMPPAVMGKDIPLGGILDPEHPRYREATELRQLIETDTDIKEVFDTARGLEGLIRQAGVHAAGVILSSEPLLDVVPIWRRDADGAIITQWDFPTCESVGLLKMDFLGLRNLTVIEDALINITANGGEPIVLETLPLADRPTYELLARGDTLGVFQLDGGPMRALLRSMAPDTFQDIAAVLALYRPGPMGANSHTEYADRKTGRKPVTPIHPELAEPLAEILDETYGLIVYQEQVMAIAQKVAGYSLGKADLLRRAMGKKKKEILDKEFVPFSEGMKANGYSADAVRTLWDILVPFSDYAFNKSHTAGYGLVSYWTAYLKANYPAEYMAALLTSVRDDKDKMAVYLAECRRMGIRVLPPDVNESAAMFAPVGTDIRFGLSAIRNVGVNVVASIVRTRKEKGQFADFPDFLRKIEAVACNKKVIESLIKAGAFDSLRHSRKGLCLVHDVAVDQVMDTKRAEANGQFDLFGGGDESAAAGLIVDVAIPTDEWDKTELLAFEREMLGLYVSSHPLLGVEHLITSRVDLPIAQLGSDDVEDGAAVTVGGVLSGLQRRVTKQGKPWASATIEDLEGSIDVRFFPSTYEQVGVQLVEDGVVLVKGRVDKRESTAQLIAMELTVIDVTAPAEDRGPLALVLPAQRVTPPLVERLREILRSHAGTTEVRIKLLGSNGETVLALAEDLRVARSGALMGDLKALLGAGGIQ